LTNNKVLSDTEMIQVNFLYD